MPRMTKRQKECKRISKKRAAKKRWSNIWQRGYVIFSSTMILSACSAVGWFWYSGEASKFFHAVHYASIDKTKELGFVVDQIYVTGREATSLETMRNTLSLEKGDPILAVDVNRMRSKLEDLPRVKYAQVGRSLPDTVHIQIMERKPIALWQNNKQLQVIDEEGVVIDKYNARDTSHLLLVVGEGAPKQAKSLLEVLAVKPELLDEVEAAIWVGARRWNIRFKNGLEVKLPEENVQVAWETLANMHHESSLLGGQIQSIDLRIEGKTYVKTPQQIKYTKPEIQGQRT